MSVALSQHAPRCMHSFCARPRSGFVGGSGAGVCSRSCVPFTRSSPPPREQAQFVPFESQVAPFDSHLSTRSADLYHLKRYEDAESA